MLFLFIFLALIAVCLPILLFLSVKQDQTILQVLQSLAFWFYKKIKFVIKHIQIIIKYIKQKIHFLIIYIQKKIAIQKALKQQQLDEQRAQEERQKKIQIEREQKKHIEEQRQKQRIQIEELQKQLQAEFEEIKRQKTETERKQQLQAELEKKRLQKLEEERKHNKQAELDRKTRIEAEKQRQRILEAESKQIKNENLSQNKQKRPNLKCKDGDYVRSKSERDIDNFFYENQIRHKYEVKYEHPRTKEWAKPDFYLPDYNLYIEYFGLNTKEYIKNREHKIKMYTSDKTIKFDYLTYEDDSNIYDKLKEICRKHNIP